MPLRLYNPTESNTQIRVVGVGNYSFLFSYDTAVAVRTPTASYRLHNHWGPTTGRHIKLWNADKYTVISADEMYAIMVQAILDTAADKLGAKF